MAAEQPVQVGTDLVSFTFAEGVALSTSCLEEIGTLLCVSCVVKSVSKMFSFVWSCKQHLGASWRQQRKMETEMSGLEDKVFVRRRYDGRDISRFYVESAVSWSGCFGGGVYGVRVPLASTTLEELETIAKIVQVLFAMPCTHSRSFNAFEANRTIQWHSSPSDVMDSANFRRKGKKYVPSLKGILFN